MREDKGLDVISDSVVKPYKSSRSAGSAPRLRPTPEDFIHPWISTICTVGTIEINKRVSFVSCFLFPVPEKCVNPYIRHGFQTNRWAPIQPQDRRCKAYYYVFDDKCRLFGARGPIMSFMLPQENPM